MGPSRFSAAEETTPKLYLSPFLELVLGTLEPSVSFTWNPSLYHGNVMEPWNFQNLHRLNPLGTLEPHGSFGTLEPLLGTSKPPGGASGFQFFPKRPGSLQLASYLMSQSFEGAGAGWSAWSKHGESGSKPEVF